MVYMSTGYNNVEKYLDKIYYYSETNKTVTYAIGQKDQRGWFVASSTGTFDVIQGMNEIDMKNYKIKSPGNYKNIIPGTSLFTRGATRFDTEYPLFLLNLNTRKCCRTYYSSEVRFQPLTHSL